MEKAKQRLVFMGLKHSGKSSLSRQASREFKIPCLDLDDCIAEIARLRYPELQDKSDSAMCVRQLYQKFGKETFVALETIAATKAVEKTIPIIIALGGGTMENPAAMAILEPQSTILFLDAPCDILFRRIIKGGVPAFLDPIRPEEHFREIFQRRREIAKKYADFIINIESKNLEEIYVEVRNVLKEQLNAR